MQSILNENYSYILVQTTIRQFIASKVSDESQTQQQVLDKNESPVIFELPFRGQEICRRSTQTNCRPQSEDQCNYQPCVHKSKDQGLNQSERRQATPLWVDNVLRITFSVTCVIQVNYVSYTCRSTLSPAKLDMKSTRNCNRKPPDGSAQYVPKWYCTTVSYLEWLTCLLLLYYS